jgi:hypothetical protein|tara:strand:- start:1794 stop:2099 length:306 start_codon:yes stop_codon:yes gene_type:complete
MNTLYALLIISAIGGVEETYRFDSLDDCENARTLIEQKTMCVGVKVRNPSADIKEFFSSFSAMTKDFRNRKDIDDEQIKDESIDNGPIREYDRPDKPGITL